MSGKEIRIFWMKKKARHNYLQLNTGDFRRFDFRIRWNLGVLYQEAILVEGAREGLENMGKEISRMLEMKDPLHVTRLAIIFKCK